MTRLDSTHSNAPHTWRQGLDSTRGSSTRGGKIWTRLERSEYVLSGAILKNGGKIHYHTNSYEGKYGGRQSTSVASSNNKQIRRRRPPPGKRRRRPRPRPGAAAAAARRRRRWSSSRRCSVPLPSPWLPVSARRETQPLGRGFRVSCKCNRLWIVISRRALFPRSPFFSYYILLLLLYKFRYVICYVLFFFINNFYIIYGWYSAISWFFWKFLCPYCWRYWINHRYFFFILGIIRN